MSDEALLRGLVRPNILSLEPYHCAREKVQEGILLDANENPFPRLVEQAVVNRYPDPYQRALRSALGDYLGIGPESILAGAGSDEVLDWIFKVFCQPGVDRVAIAEPTYGMYRVMADVFGVGIDEFRLDSRWDFDSEEFLKRVGSDVKVLFLCSPNNPTGNLLSEERIVEVLRRWHGILVVDEAYVEFAASGSLAARVGEFPNLLVMRTFSKAFGRAGIRLGYAVACEQVIEHCRKVKAPYNLNAMTLNLGVRAVRDLEDTRNQINAILRERERVQHELASIPEIRRIYPSQSNFILFQVEDANRLCEHLFREGIVVRNRSSLPGLSESVRVSIGTPEENSRFLECLRAYFKGTEDE